MSNFPATLIILVVGIVIGSYITSKVLAIRTRKKRHATDFALREIASHKWDTGEHNDAVVITRIALRGLKGEMPEEVDANTD